MTLNMKMTANFDLGKIKLDLHRELNQGIDVVADNIQEGVDNGIQFQRPLKANKDSTLKQKKRLGQGSKPLIAEGILRDESKMQRTDATTTKQEATLRPPAGREKVSFWNQEGTPNIPSRPHFAISIKAEAKVDKIIDTKIRKAIDRSRRARIA